VDNKQVVEFVAAHREFARKVAAEQSAREDADAKYAAEVPNAVAALVARKVLTKEAGDRLAPRLQDPVKALQLIVKLAERLEPAAPPPIGDAVPGAEKAAADRGGAPDEGREDPAYAAFSRRMAALR